MEHLWNHTDRETEGLTAKPAPVSHCSPQTPRGLAWNGARASAVRYLSVGTNKCVFYASRKPCLKTFCSQKSFVTSDLRSSGILRSVGG
jgi:hypothetical protein